MLAVNISVLVLEIIRFQNLHIVLNSRGCCHPASCIAYGQTAALRGCNEHLETGTKSTEILNIIFLKPRYGFLSVFDVGLNRYSATAFYTQGTYGRVTATGKNFTC